MLRTHTFYTVGRKKAETAPIEKIEVLELGISVDPNRLAPTALDEGFLKFINDQWFTSLIRTELDLLDEDGEEIEPLSTTAEIRKKFPIGQYDRLEPAKVEFTSKHRSSRCERFLPPIMKFTLGAELALLIPLLAAASGSTQIELFRMTPTEGASFGTAESLLFMAYNVLNTFFAPGGNNMGATGYVFDNTFHSLWRWLTCKKSRTQQYQEEKVSTCDLAKKWASKGFVTLFSLGFIYTDFLMNYQQYKSMSQIVDFMAPYSIFPKEAISFGMLANFWANQANDPVYTFSSWYFFNKAINKKYTPKVRIALPSPAIDEEKDIEKAEDELKAQLIPEAQGSSVNETDPEPDEPRRSICLIM